MNIIFIPIRGGSKSIPLKNIKVLNGKPLIYWTLKASLKCKYSDKVYISTDDGRIKNIVFDLMNDFDLIKYNDKIEVIDRSFFTATDTASTESAMIEFANNYDFTNICLVQATSPLLTEEDLNGGFEVFFSDKVDSVISAVKQRRFNWMINREGYAISINYDYRHRPRRQDFDGYYVENGAFYITTKKNLLKTNNRLSGNIKIYEMDEYSYYEIDEPKDFMIIESIMRYKNNNDLDKTKIKMILTDVDGCLTDGGMYYSEKGDELKKFNARDGMAFRILKEKGYIVGIITAESVKINKTRAQKLNLDICKLGVKNKLNEIYNLCEQYHIKTENVLYIGDDINDFEVLKNVGIGCCPNDAIKEVKNISKIILNVKGGQGVVREVLDFLIE